MTFQAKLFSLAMLAVVFALPSVLFGQTKEEIRKTVQYAIDQTPEYFNHDLIGQKIQTWINLGEEDKAFDYLNRLSGWQFRQSAIGKIAGLAKRDDNVELLKRLLQSAEPIQKSKDAMEATVFRTVASMKSFDAMDEMVKLLDTPVKRDQAWLRLIRVNENNSKSPTGEELEFLESVFGQLESREGKFIGGCILSRAFLLANDLERGEDFCPSDEEFAWFMAEFFVGRGARHQRPPAGLGRLASWAHRAFIEEIPNGILLAKLIRAKGSERQELIEEAPYGGRWPTSAIERLIDFGHVDLAIELGLPLELKNNPFGGGGSFGESGKRDPFLQIVRRKPPLKRDHQPLLKLLDQYLSDGKPEKAVDLATRLESTDFAGFAMFALLESSTVDESTKAPLPKKLTNWLLDRIQTDRNRAYSFHILSREFLRFEAKRVDAQHAASLLAKVRPHHQQVFESLVPVVAAALLNENHLEQAYDLFEDVEVKQTVPLVIRCITELCYDDHIEPAWDLYQRFLNEDQDVNPFERSNRNGPLRSMALCALRTNQPQMVMMTMQAWQTETSGDVQGCISSLLSLTRIAKERKDNQLLNQLLEYAIEKELKHYSGPMLLAEMGKFQAAMDLCDKVRGERAMNYQMLAKSLSKYRAPAEIFATCIKNIDKPSRREWALENESIKLGYQKDIEKVLAAGKLFEDLEPRYRAAYWTGVAAGLSHYCRED